MVAALAVAITRSSSSNLAVGALTMKPAGDDGNPFSKEVRRECRQLVDDGNLLRAFQSGVHAMKAIEARMSDISPETFDVIGLEPLFVHVIGMREALEISSEGFRAIAEKLDIHRKMGFDEEDL